MSGAPDRPSAVAGLRFRSPVDPLVMERIRLVPVARTEFLLTAHLLPLVIAVSGKSHDLMMVAAPAALNRQIIDQGNRWLAPYQPVFVRALPFTLAPAVSGDPLHDLVPHPVSNLLSTDTGEPVIGADRQPTAAVKDIHGVLVRARADLPVLRQALEDLLIAGIATPLGPQAKFLADGRVPRPRLYTVSPKRLAGLSTLVFGRLARDSFIAVELAYAIAFSRRWLLPDLLVNETSGPSEDQSSPMHKPLSATTMRGDAFSLGFDESDLFRFP